MKKRERERERKKKTKKKKRERERRNGGMHGGREGGRGEGGKARGWFERLLLLQLALWMFLHAAGMEARQRVRLENKKSEAALRCLGARHRSLKTFPCPTSLERNLKS